MSFVRDILRLPVYDGWTTVNTFLSAGNIHVYEHRYDGNSVSDEIDTPIRENASPDCRLQSAVFEVNVLRGERW